MASKHPTRTLGRDGPQVPALGFGLMGLSSFYGVPTPDSERFALLDRAHELGCVHWDSAALYGDSEELLGNWFERTGKRTDIFLATKFGNHVSPDGGREVRNDSEYIRMAVAKSLERLKTDYIDLLYCSGKVRYLGLSECTASTLRRACKIHPIHAYQIEYSPFSLDIEKRETALLETCRELGIATVAYSPLGRGMLTGQYTSIDDFDVNDFRRSIPRFSKDNFGRNLQLVEVLRGIADKKRCTTGQLTLAWLMCQGADIFPIPGTKRIKYLEENMGALEIRLTEAEERVIREAVEGAEVWGTRVAETLMRGLVMDTPELE
ncbi:MAG: hypothetical protein LQ345_005844 [Seirophora villosa]|nr:MAG: hypothetical protein LQ345_005844 [Seirophora villosa]